MTTNEEILHNRGLFKDNVSGWWDEILDVMSLARQDEREKIGPFKESIEAYEKGAKDEAKRIFEKLAKFRCRKGRCGLCVDCVIGFAELKKECGVK